MSDLGKIIIACSLSLGLLGLGIWAYWDAKRDQSVYEIDLEYEGSTLFDNLILAPSEVVERTFRIHNGGTEPCTYSIYFDNVRGDLQDQVYIKIYYENELKHEAILSELTSSHPFQSEEILTKASAHSYTIELSILPEAGNDMMDKTLMFDLKVNAINNDKD